MTERQRIAKWIRAEIDLLASRRDSATNPMLHQYWVGQRDAHIFLADAIEDWAYRASPAERSIIAKTAAAARNAKLSPDRRREIASAAAKARWAKESACVPDLASA